MAIELDLVVTELDGGLTAWWKTFGDDGRHSSGID